MTRHPQTPVSPVLISAVLPTYQRAAALRTHLVGFLALAGVDELVVVDDGGTDETAEVLAAYDDPRLRVLRAPERRGSAATRNLGADAARGEWLLYLEDDCEFPVDYACVLLADALEYGADVVGAPMVHVRPGGAVAAAVEAARERAEGDRGLDEVAGFPTVPTPTPLLPAPALVRAAVARRIRFDEGFRYNAYREETDFFLRVVAAGGRCLLTPRTCFWETARYPGGQPRQPVRAEWWTLRNNWRFLRRHETALVAAGLIRGAAYEQAAFALRRARRWVPRAAAGYRAAVTNEQQPNVQPDERPTEVVDSGVGTPTGAPAPEEITEADEEYVSRRTRDAGGVTGSEEGGPTSGGGGEAATTPLVGANRREGDDAS